MVDAPLDEQVEIVRAGEEHLQQIVRLAESRNLSTTDRTDTGATESGFLVSAYTEADYRARLGTAEQFYVAVKGGEVLAFLLAYTSDQLEPDEWLNHRIKITLGGFLVIKQVCVARGAARLGIGSMLYYRVLEHWQESPVIAAVVNDPPNEASSRFHHKLGFQELTQLTPPDGRQRVVWVWRKPREAMLQVQYAIAVDLYKHEDNTNWQKLNNFFYITAGLAAATAFALGKEGAGGGHSGRSPGLDHRDHRLRGFGGLLPDAALRTAVSARTQERGDRPRRGHGLARRPADSVLARHGPRRHLSEDLANRDDHGPAAAPRRPVLARGLRRADGQLRACALRCGERHRVLSNGL
ncbi:GNAT family N-acetyltransferase [Streptomyces cacaoi]|uniref:N-acetyltransferase domain-containing protein n=1 Tax=Streptomyces cacaoi TaxID=1898 RepID=A0A4Y3QRA6_STRCI|nr:GNAT family N-acetyltransferase [Streptomyces cacaoi]GEB47916.1 hypothetical protein SCA03_04670 [Streptomyces cacaoi]